MSERTYNRFMTIASAVIIGGSTLVVIAGLFNLVRLIIA